jgi:hypothetical protein
MAFKKQAKVAPDWGPHIDERKINPPCAMKGGVLASEEEGLK